MQPATTTPDGMHQAKPLTAQKDIEALLLDLIGDLAAYRPGGKVVVFEGGGNSEFDVNFVNQLFPEFASKVNGIAGGSKAKYVNYTKFSINLVRTYLLKFTQ